MNYWRYRAGTTVAKGTDSKEELYYNWHKDCEQGVMTQKQERIRDIRQYSTKAELKKIRPNNTGRAANAWDLCNTITNDDIIFSIGKGNEVLAVGVVTGEYFYDETDDFRFHKRPVQWFLEMHTVHHGLRQGSLSRFNLKEKSSKETLSILLSLYGKFLGKIEKEEIKNV